MSWQPAADEWHGQEWSRAEELQDLGWATVQVLLLVVEEAGEGRATTTVTVQR